MNLLEQIAPRFGIGLVSSREAIERRPVRANSFLVEVFAACHSSRISLLYKVVTEADDFLQHLERKLRFAAASSIGRNFRECYVALDQRPTAPTEASP